MNQLKKEPLPKPKLYSYFRSSASYRLRIALNLKQVEYEQISINLRSGEQNQSEFKLVNPQEFVPVLQIGSITISQSLAIIDYLEHLYPQPPIYPKDPISRARVLELAYIVAMDIHPLNNHRVLKYLTEELKTEEDSNLRWYKHWVYKGFDAFEHKLQQSGQKPLFCCGGEVTLADICLIPQVYNALRYDCDMARYKVLMRIYENCLTLPAFEKAQPKLQVDAI